MVARHLLAGAYDAGLTHLHYAREHPGELRVQEVYGAVDTTWVVYGARKRFRGEVIGQRNPWLFTGEPTPANERPPRGEPRHRSAREAGMACA